MTDAEIDDLVTDAARVSDRGFEGLRVFAGAFIDAHKRVPGGLSLEVGTRDGGSAILFLAMLIHMYPAQHRPYLFTVDPYGSKPYDAGGVPIYTDVNYVAMKQLLARFPHHVHFHMESLEFFRRMYDLPYWRTGNETVPVQSVASGEMLQAPVGEEHKARDLGFALLDGEHDFNTIHRELWELLVQRHAGWGSAMGWLAQDGVIAIDNIDDDKRVRPFLQEGSMGDGWKFKAEFPEHGDWAVVRRVGEYK